MNQSNVSKLPVAIISLVVVAAAIGIGWLIFQGDRQLLKDVSLDHQVITPNADGEDDATTIRYEITDNASVSIYFDNMAGDRFYFRRDESRGVGEYEVLFSGIVDGYRLPGDVIDGEIQARLLQNGEYAWTIAAVDDSGEQEYVSGALTIAAADIQLPEIRDFSLDKHEFTPNQDGIDDRVQIQFFLPKEVESSRVFLITAEGAEMPVAEVERDVEPGSPGRHYFDYEGGVDNNATPPADGTYPVVAVVEDAEGQKIRVEDQLSLRFGGVPRAEIISPAAGDTVEWSATTAPVCDTVTFTLTVQNYGSTPIRTSGPAPGTVYDSDWNYNTLGWHTESGAWRVAIGYENELSNYPYRWAIGEREDLQKIGDHYYLMPGDRAVVTGSIRIVGPFGERNPQPIWAGLIHEDVEISQFNNRVDPRQFLVDLPDPDNISDCAEREIPMVMR